MPTTRTLLACLLLTSAAIVPATAQMYPGGDVTVNAGAMGHGYLLYPGGKYGRHVGQLLQPGERPGARVRLHLPMHHRVAKSGPTKPTRIASLPPARPPAPPVHTAPVTTDLNALPEDSATRLVAAPTAPVARPAKPPVKPAQSMAATSPATDGGAALMPFAFGAPPVKPAPAPPPRTRIANATPAPAVTVPSVAAGMKKQSTVLFAAGASSPVASDVDAIHALAGTLNAALSAGATRIQLDAFGGPRGDKSSDSRRLSLKRALVVRELLIKDGVPSEKIDVRAMGGVDDSGIADRVDVFVRA